MADVKSKTFKIYMCGNQRAGGAGCISPGAREVLSVLKARAEQHAEQIDVIESTCMGYCGQGPNVKIHGGAFFHNVQVEDVDEILNVLQTRKTKKARQKAS